eukprot:7804664-Alexandrium_andersonii.AAC.1
MAVVAPITTASLATAPPPCWAFPQPRRAARQPCADGPGEAAAAAEGCWTPLRDEVPAGAPPIRHGRPGTPTTHTVAHTRRQGALPELPGQGDGRGVVAAAAAAAWPSWRAARRAAPRWPRPR